MAITLRIISGQQAGLIVTLSPGETLIGRSPSARIQLTDPTASFEHAVVRCSDEGVVLQNLSAQGTIVSGKHITDEVVIAAKDRISIGETELAIDMGALGGGHKSARMSRTLALVSVILLLLLASAIFRPASVPTSRQSDLRGRQIVDAYVYLEQWSRQQVGRRQLPAASLILLTDAWRLDRASRYDDAADAFGRLALLLRSLPAPQSLERKSLADADAEHADALLRLFGGTKSADDGARTVELEGAALLQFARFRFEKNTQFGKAKP
ncbi:MAG: FHA domain-containing protein [Phycisphaeraceae bacterium]